MENEIIKGIVLTSFDYKEKDKLVEIYSLEKGKILATLKSPTLPKSKLKYAYQPFCFAEFEINQKGSYKLIKNAYLLDSFFSISSNIENYYIATLFLELVRYTGEDNLPNPELFLLLLNSLKNICYEDYPAKILALKFCLSYLQILGYELNFSSCVNCDCALQENVYFDMFKGGFVCEKCNIQAIKISKKCFDNLKLINSTNTENLKQLQVENEVTNESLILLMQNIENRIMRKIKTKIIL